MSQNAGGGESSEVSANEYRLYSEAQTNFGDLIPRKVHTQDGRQEGRAAATATVGSAPRKGWLQVKGRPLAAGRKAKQQLQQQQEVPSQQGLVTG